MTAALRIWLAVALLIVLAVVVWQSEPTVCVSSQTIEQGQQEPTFNPTTCE